MIRSRRTESGEGQEIGPFRKASFPAANRIEHRDPEWGTQNPEGEAEIRGEPGIVGLESGNG